MQLWSWLRNAETAVAGLQVQFSLSINPDECLLYADKIFDRWLWNTFQSLNEKFLLSLTSTPSSLTFLVLNQCRRMNFNRHQKKFTVTKDGLLLLLSFYCFGQVTSQPPWVTIRVGFRFRVMVGMRTMIGFEMTFLFQVSWPLIWKYQCQVMKFWQAIKQKSVASSIFSAD